MKQIVTCTSFAIVLLALAACDSKSPSSPASSSGNTTPPAQTATSGVTPHSESSKLPASPSAAGPSEAGTAIGGMVGGQEKGGANKGSTPSSTGGDGSSGSK